jgi:tetratricopeptide (TPR) repeat protein
VIDVLNYPPPDWSRKPSRRDSRRASQLNDQGRAELAGGDLASAEKLFMESIEVVPLSGMPWFNLGLIYKRQRRWREAVACNTRSIALGTDENDPAFWNLGIAATALRDWDTARSAWTGFGIEITPGAGPIEMDWGPSPVRINPTANAEVLWGRRIDPARIQLENVPLPASGHRWHDIVLHDGEPRGERSIGDRTFPVFDELERWEPSSVPTWECLINGPVGQIEELADRFHAGGWALEDWSANIRRLCDTCSRGSLDAHSHGAFAADRAGNHVGVAAPAPIAESLLDEWTKEVPGSSRTDLIPVEDG